MFSRVAGGCGAGEAAGSGGAGVAGSGCAGGFGRVVFVGDRGMVTAENLESLQRAHHGFVVGLDRRRNSELKGWLDLVDDTKWVDTNMMITE